MLRETLVPPTVSLFREVDEILEIVNKTEEELNLLQQVGFQTDQNKSQVFPRACVHVCMNCCCVNKTYIQSGMFPMYVDA